MNRDETLMRYRVEDGAGENQELVLEQRHTGRVFLKLEGTGIVVSIELTPGLLQELRRVLGKV